MLATRNVFLDTSAIIQQNFDYSGHALKRLEELARAGGAHLLTTSIVAREVEANIRERVGNAELALGKFKNNYSILKNVTAPVLQALFADFNRTQIEDGLIEQYRRFLDRTQTEEIPLETASASDVFDQYFGRKPPFGDGKKKSEFPDAFTISALEGWSSQRNEKVYVITTDPDLTRHCDTSERLIGLQKPSEFIDAFLRQDAAMQVVEESTSEQLEAIERTIKREFEHLGFYLDDENGDVNDVSVTQVEVDRFSLLQVVNRVATFEVDARVDYVASVSFDDMETAIWDSEDGVAMPFRTIDTEVARSAELTATLQVQLDAQGRFESITSIGLPTEDIAITVRDEDWYK